MSFVLLIPTFLSCLLLAAHFFFHDHLILVIASCALPLLLVPRRPWLTRLLQAMLIVGALEWVRTIFQIAAVRQAKGDNWHRMAIILGSVAAFTAISALLLFLPPLNRVYAPRPASEVGSPSRRRSSLAPLSCRAPRLLSAGWEPERPRSPTRP